MSRFDDEYRKGAALSGSHRNEMPMASLGVYLLSDGFDCEKELATSLVLGSLKFPRPWLRRLIDAFGGQTHIAADDPARPVYEALASSVGPDRAAVIMLGLGGEWGARLKANAQFAIAAERPVLSVPPLLRMARDNDRRPILHADPWPRRFPAGKDRSAD